MIYTIIYFILFLGDGGNQLEAKLDKPADDTGTKLL
jgi:hypothetical protein